MTKQRGWAGAERHGKWLGDSWGEFVERRVISVCLYRLIVHFSIDSPSLGTRMFSSWYSEGNFLLGNFVLFLGRKGKIGENLSERNCFSNSFSSKWPSYQNNVFWEWGRILNAFMSLSLYTFLSSSVKWKRSSTSQSRCKNSRAYTLPSFSQTWRKAWSHQQFLLAVMHYFTWQIIAEHPPCSPGEGNVLLQVILPGEFSWTEEPGRHPVHVVAKSQAWQLSN